MTFERLCVFCVFCLLLGCERHPTAQPAVVAPTDELRLESGAPIALKAAANVPDDTQVVFTLAGSRPPVHYRIELNATGESSFTGEPFAEGAPLSAQVSKAELLPILRWAAAAEFFGPCSDEPKREILDAARTSVVIRINGQQRSRGSVCRVSERLRTANNELVHEIHAVAASRGWVRPQTPRDQRPEIQF